MNKMQVIENAQEAFYKMKLIDMEILESCLILRAKELGFTSTDIEIEGSLISKPIHDQFRYDVNFNQLYFGSILIYNNGIWAKIKTSVNPCDKIASVFMTITILDNNGNLMSHNLEATSQEQKEGLLRSGYKIVPQGDHYKFLKNLKIELLCQDQKSVSSAEKQ